MKNEIIQKIKWLVSNSKYLIKRDILVEELSELLESTNSPRLYISKWTNDTVIEEFADVYTIVSQIVVYLGENTIPDYIEHYEDKASMVSSVETMSFLQKATHTIWVVSKIRREQDVIQNFKEFRAVIYLLCEALESQLEHLRDIKQNDILDKIYKMIEYKVNRQVKRQEDELYGSNSAETPN